MPIASGGWRFRAFASSRGYVVRDLRSVHRMEWQIVTIIILVNRLPRSTYFSRFFVTATRTAELLELSSRASAVAPEIYPARRTGT